MTKKLLYNLEAHNSLFVRYERLYLTKQGYYLEYYDSTTEYAQEGYVHTQYALSMLHQLQAGVVNLYGCKDEDLYRDGGGTYVCVTYVH